MALSHDLTTEDGVREYLQRGLYPACHRVERLSDGVSGFVYRAWQQASTEPATFIVKHVENYAARSQNWKLDQHRMNFEYEALKYLSAASTQDDGLIRVPNLYHHDKEAHVIVMEDAGNVPSLKSWLNSERDPTTVTTIGTALGRYLARIHNASAGNETLLQRFDGNATAKYLSGTFFFGGLPASAEKWDYTDECFKEAARIGQLEVNTCKEVLTLGDFWTGNILISEAPQLAIRVVDLEFSKPGTAAFDVGQMAAEMYFLAALRYPILGFALLDSFLGAYRENRQAKIDVGKVAIRVGAHMFAVLPRIWSVELSDSQIREQLEIGAKLIHEGVAGDEPPLRCSILHNLYTL